MTESESAPASLPSGGALQPSEDGTGVCDCCGGEGEIEDPDERYPVITCPECTGVGRVPAEDA
jgi:hypothetical protein